jgi:hypothetical protein
MIQHRLRLLAQVWHSDLRLADKAAALNHYPATLPEPW